jgi:hypothetical protein
MQGGFAAYGDLRRGVVEWVIFSLLFVVEWFGRYLAP